MLLAIPGTFRRVSCRGIQPLLTPTWNVCDTATLTYLVSHMLRWYGAGGKSHAGILGHLYGCALDSREEGLDRVGAVKNLGMHPGVMVKGEGRCHSLVGLKRSAMFWRNVVTCGFGSNCSSDTHPHAVIMHALCNGDVDVPRLEVDTLLVNLSNGQVAAGRRGNANRTPAAVD